MLKTHNSQISARGRSKTSANHKVMPSQSDPSDRQNTADPEGTLWAQVAMQFIYPPMAEFQSVSQHISISMNTIIKICFFSLVGVLGCSESTNSSGGTLLNGTWQEEFVWGSNSIYIYPADSVMTKKSILSFLGNSFTLKIIPPHRYVNPDNKTHVTSMSDSIYSGSYQIIDSKISFYTKTPFEGSMEFYYQLQNDTIYIWQDSTTYGGSRIYPILWAAGSNKYSGTFSKVY